MISISVWFDAKLGHARARFRGPGYDKKTKVPDEVFTERGLDPRRWTKQAEIVAQAWAFDEKDRLQGKRPTGRSATGKMTLEEIHELYRRRNPDGVQDVTLRKNQFLFNNLIEFEAFRALTPDMIDSAAVLDYYAWRTREAAPRSATNEIRLLKQLLTYAQEWQRETGIASIRFAKLPSRITREAASTPARGVALSVDQFFAVLATKGVRPRLTKRFHRVMVVGVTTGLRRANLLGLRWSWIDLERRWLTIPAKHMKGRLTDRRDLSIPLCDWAMDAIGVREGASDFVFASPRGGKTWRFDETLVSMAQKAGVPRFTLHDLRRTGASWLGRRGVEERVIAALLGHKARVNRLGQQLLQTGGVTRSRYLFVEDEELRTAAATFDAIREEFANNPQEASNRPKRPSSGKLFPKVRPKSG
jgi:integrase